MRTPLAATDSAALASGTTIRPRLTSTADAGEVPVGAAFEKILRKRIENTDPRSRGGNTATAAAAGETSRQRAKPRALDSSAEIKTAEPGSPQPSSVVALLAINRAETVGTAPAQALRFEALASRLASPVDVERDEKLPAPVDTSGRPPPSPNAPSEEPQVRAEPGDATTQPQTPAATDDREPGARDDATTSRDAAHPEPAAQWRAAPPGRNPRADQGAPNSDAARQRDIGPNAVSAPALARIDVIEPHHTKPRSSAPPSSRVQATSPAAGVKTSTEPGLNWVEGVVGELTWSGAARVSRREPRGTETPPSSGALPQPTTSSADTIALPTTPRLAPPLGGPDWSAAFAEHTLQLAVSQIAEARLEVNPREAGAVSVRISTEGANVDVHFSAENPQLRDAIERALPQLHDLMSNAGLTLTQTSIGADHGRRSSERRPSNPINAAAARPVVAPAVQSRPASPPTARANGGVDLYA